MLQKNFLTADLVEEEKVQEEKLPLVQIDVADQELGQDTESSVLRTLRYESDFLTYLLQDPLQQLVGVQIEVKQEELSAALDGMNP